MSAARAFARLKCALFDFVYFAGRHPSYAGLAVLSGTTDQDKIAAARAAALADGPLAAQRQRILEVLEQLESWEAQLGTYLNGLLEVRETKSGEVWFHFELNRQREWLSIAEVISQAAELSRLLPLATETLGSVIHQLKSR